MTFGRRLFLVLFRSLGPSSIFAAAVLLVLGSLSSAGLLFLAGVGALIGWRLRNQERSGADSEPTEGLWSKLSNRARVMLVWIITMFGTSFALFTGVPPSPWSYLAILGSALTALFLTPAATTGRWRFGGVAQLTLVSVILRAMGWFAYPPAYVGVDSWYHAVLISEINTNGAIPSASDYQWFPSMQVTTAITSQLLGVDFRMAMFCAVSIPIATLLPIAVYKAVVGFGGSGRAALFGAFYAAVLPDLVYWGYTPIPMSLSISYFFLAVFILATATGKVKKSALLTLIFIATLLTHTIGAFVLASYFLVSSLIMPGLRLLGYTTQERTHTAVYGPTLFVILLAYWSEASGFLFPFIVRALGFGLRLEAFVAARTTPVDPYTIFAIVVSTGTGLMLAAIGSSLALTEKSKESRMLPLIGFTWFIISVTFVGQIGGFSAILPGRCAAFGLGLLAIPAGVGFSRIEMGSRMRRFRRSLLLALCLLLVAGIVVHPALSPVPASSEYYPRLGFLRSETSAAKWVDSNVGRAAIYSDSLMTLQLGSPFKTNILDGSEIITTGSSWHGYLVLRRSAALESIYVLTTGRVFWHPYTESPSSIELMEQAPTSVVYTSGSTIVLWSP